MAKRLLVDPTLVSQKLQRQFRNHCKSWLVGQGNWPFSIPLGLPTEAQASQDMSAVQHWQSHWREWQGVGELVWIERHWPRLGKQVLPEKLLIHSADDVAQWIGEAVRWQRATQRCNQWCTRWPQLRDYLPRQFNLLADYDDQDFLRLEQVLAWLVENPGSNLYIRQLPIVGIDSKWLEKRKRLVVELLSVLHDKPVDTEKEFYAVTGIRREPTLVRMRILDQQLRQRCGGLSDISAPLNQWRNMNLNPQKVFIVENQQTGLAFDDIESAIVIMGLGYSVNLLDDISWVQRAQSYYWGDIDTDGFSILNRARRYLPNLKSILMDEQTLLQHKVLWGKDNHAANASVLNLLNETEMQFYLKMVNNDFGERLRLEQERIDWQYAWSHILGLN